MNPATRYVTVALILVLLAAAAGCGKSGADGQLKEEEKPVVVQVETLEPGALKDWLDMPGKIEAWREVTVSAEVGGLLEWRGVDEGDAVAAGQKLAVIDREGLELKVRQAELALDRSRIATEQAALAVRQAEATLRSARAAQVQAEAAAAQSREQQRKARALEEESRRDLERARALFEEKLAPRSQIDELEMSVEASSADLASAEEGVRAAVAGKERALANVAAAEAGLEAARESASAAHSQVKSAESALEEARLYLRRSTIASPIGGFVDRTFNERGELVKAQDPLFRIVQTRPVKAVFHLAEKDVPYLREGMEADVTVQALASEPLAGQVEMIGVTSDPATSTYPLEVKLENAEGLLRPGMLARLRLLRQGLDGALSIPVFAVVSENGASHVFVYEGGTARRRPVSTGIVDGDRVQVTAGLAAGEQVIVKGQRDLEDGQGVALP